MTVEQMRRYIYEHYAESPHFLARVKKMNDHQIIAIYLRLIQKG